MPARAIRLAIAVALLAWCGGAATALAAPRAARTVDVTIVNFAFSPDPITIDPGDTIRWTNLDSAPHSAVSVQPAFVTVTLAQGQTTTTTFERAGTFAYVCGIHGSSMRGTVVVRGTPAETPRPSGGVAGHIVDAVYQTARPDRMPTSEDPGSLGLYASAALALLGTARLVLLLRRR